MVVSFSGYWSEKWPLMEAGWLKVCPILLTPVVMTPVVVIISQGCHTVREVSCVIPTLPDTLHRLHVKLCSEFSTESAQRHRLVYTSNLVQISTRNLWMISLHYGSCRSTYLKGDPFLYCLFIINGVPRGCVENWPYHTHRHKWFVTGTEVCLTVDT
jgi:hypothetical protein